MCSPWQGCEAWVRFLISLAADSKIGRCPIRRALEAGAAILVAVLWVSAAAECACGDELQAPDRPSQDSRSGGVQPAAEQSAGSGACDTSLAELPLHEDCFLCGDSQDGWWRQATRELVPGQTTLQVDQQPLEFWDEFHGPHGNQNPLARNLLDDQDTASAVTDLMRQMDDRVLDGTIFQIGPPGILAGDFPLSRISQQDDRDTVVRYLRRVRDTGGTSDSVRATALELPTHSPESAMARDSSGDFIRVLRDTALQLEQTAGELEEQEAYHWADELRSAAESLRVRARQAQSATSGKPF